MEWLVYILVTLFMTVRFFTERLLILPRFMNALDLVAVPLLLLVCLLWVMTAGGGRLKSKRAVVLAVIFLSMWALSWLINSAEVHWLGGALFAVGLLTPIVFYIVLINFGFGRQFCRRLLHLLSLLLAANLVIGTVDVVQGIGPRSDDFIFGTFGVNQNQLAFFLALMMAYLLARWRYHGFNLYRTLALAWTGILFLLSGFQTLWVIFAVAGGIVFIVLGKMSRRVLLIAALAVLVPTVTLVSLNFERFDVLMILSQFVTHFDQLGKVQLIGSLPQVWQSRPWAFWLGVGPGTFNSRAFRSIAIVPYAGSGNTDVAAAIVTPFYTSELSSRFIIPYFERGVFLLSGSNTDGPFTSYVSVPVEVGVFGALALFGVYGLTTLALIRSLRRSTDPQQRTLAAWALMGLLILLGIAAVDNYLETTRYTLLVWPAVAVWQIYSQGQNAPSYR